HTPSSAQVSSSVLRSLPTDVQKDIEDTRAQCRKEIELTQAPNFSSADDFGLERFTVSGSEAVLISDQSISALRARTAPIEVATGSQPGSSRATPSLDGTGPSSHISPCEIVLDQTGTARPLPALGQIEEPGSTSGETGGGAGLGQKEGAVTLRHAGSECMNDS